MLTAERKQNRNQKGRKIMADLSKEHNVYHFEMSDPVNLVDPTGMYAKPTTQPNPLSAAQIAQLKKMITGYEGNEPSVYYDKHKPPKATIGIGHNLTNDNGNCQKALGIPPQELIDGKPLSPDQVDKLFEADLADMVTQTQKTFPNFNGLPPDVQITLIDLVYNFGAAGISAFHDFCGDISRKDFLQAAWDLSHTTKALNSPISPYMGTQKGAHPPLQRALDNVNRLENTGLGQIVTSVQGAIGTVEAALP